MEAYSISDLSKQYNKLRILVFVLVTGMVLGVGIVIFGLLSLNAQYHKKVYVVHEGKGTYTAYQQEDGINVYEVKHYLYYLFTQRLFKHDLNTYDQHYEEALSFLDRPSKATVKQQFDQVGFKRQYTRFGVKSDFEIDSLRFDEKTKEGIVLGQQVLSQETGEEMQRVPMGFRFKVVRSTGRTAQNPSNFLISDFNFIAYNPN